MVFINEMRNDILSMNVEIEKMTVSKRPKCYTKQKILNVSSLRDQFFLVNNTINNKN